MPYDYKQWAARHRERVDITSGLTHLTRPARIDGRDLSAVEVLVKIVREERINGSTTESGFIVGSRPAVCFMDAPLLALAQNILTEKARAEKNPQQRVRYSGVGVVFNKTLAYNKGARPVFYEETEKAKKLLPPEEHWRIVDLDLSKHAALTDWMHEREWRCPGDFAFQVAHSALVVNSNEDYRELLLLAPELAAQVCAVTNLAHALA